MEQGEQGCINEDVECWVQLYRTQEGKYLLDIQRIDGPNFLFMDLCTAFLAEVGAV